MPQIGHAMTMPIMVTAKMVPTIIHTRLHQNVRICHEKCDSIHVPRASSRLTYATITPTSQVTPTKNPIA